MRARELTVPGTRNARAFGDPPWLIRSAAIDGVTPAGAAALREAEADQPRVTELRDRLPDGAVVVRPAAPVALDGVLQSVPGLGQQIEALRREPGHGRRHPVQHPVEVGVGRPDRPVAPGGGHRSPPRTRPMVPENRSQSARSVPSPVGSK